MCPPPAPFDVIDARTGQKIATAAQKRTKHGLLFQGTIFASRRREGRGGGGLDWDVFYETFIDGLTAALGAEAQEIPWPDFAEGELDALAEQYASPEWNEFR